MKKRKRPMQLFDDVIQWIVVAILLYIGWLTLQEVISWL